MLLDVPSGIFGGVLVFHHQPFVALLAVPKLDQNEAAPQLLAVQIELDFLPF